MVTSNPTLGSGRDKFAGFAAFGRRSFIAYARWLDSISWKRFFLLSVLALIAAAILSDLPPFSLKWGSDRVVYDTAAPPKPPKPPKAPAAGQPANSGSKNAPLVIGGKPYEIVVDSQGVRIGPIDRDADGARSPSVTVDKNGVRIQRGGAAASAASATPAASAASGASSLHDDLDAAQTAAEAARAEADVARAKADAAASGARSVAPYVTIRLPDKADTDDIRNAIEEAANAIESAVKEAASEGAPRKTTIRAFRLGDHLPPFTFLLIVLSIVTKIMAAGRFKAEAQAVVATEMAESEALKRQVVEARMAAMQAQVEPHFLFNTLASIDHLIETDPPRASKMQKNLIALLRASMPSMREANAQGTRDLGRELAVIRPFLEILKVRMEDRLQTDVRVSDGLLSAEFPPMMLQGLVENAIKHGLEPKAEGGTLKVLAEIVHGKLAVTVVDTGVGFGKAATAGTGIGLSNIRERLQLLYGSKAALTVADNPGGGTSVTITVPYITREASADTMAA